jgi:uncharacterized protein YjiS (DUF1127 family)
MQGMQAMSALTTLGHPARVAPPVAIFAATLARFRRQVVAAWRHRNEVAMLVSFDDYMLKDIGLTRGDLDDALAEPLWRDPTAVLVRRQRRRRARSATAVTLLPAAAAPSLVPDAEPSSRRDPPAWLTS